VSGLGYSSGGQSGVTDASGGFTYEVGQNVTFRVGGVTLGTTQGGATLTPLNLVANASSSTTAVQNLVRFLMLMDVDGNPANGITISEALRGRAASWPAVDFNTTDLPAALASIIPDTQVDGALRALPTAAAAQTHFEASFRCMFSGLFRGAYAGDDNGRFYLIVLPNGGLAGAGYSIPDDEIGVLNFPPPRLLAVENGAPFVAGFASSGSSFSGSFTSYSALSGTWTDGTFTGERHAGTAAAAYKFYSILIPDGGGPAVGAVFIELDSNDAVTAAPVVDVRTGQTAQLNPVLNGEELTITSPTIPGTITGTLNTQNLTLTGRWTNPDLGVSGSLLSVACRLK
jgi:hypothetical protein